MELSVQDLSPGIALASAGRMRIHHLNCVSTCPLGGALMDARSFSSLRARLTCHCLLVETSRELVLVDTGFGLRDIADPRSRLSKFFLFLLRPEFREEYAAVRQIASRGYDPRDVRHIVLTHLDFDHAGGLDDFPQATVHMLKRRGDWLLQAGDAYFYHAEMDPQRPRCTPGLRFYQWMMEKGALRASPPRSVDASPRK